jgi:hypothetical protein
MEAAGSSEMFVITCMTTRCRNPEGHTAKKFGGETVWEGNGRHQTESQRDCEVENWVHVDGNRAQWQTSVVLNRRVPLQELAAEADA